MVLRFTDLAIALSLSILVGTGLLVAGSSVALAQTEITNPAVPTPVDPTPLAPQVGPSPTNAPAPIQLSQPGTPSQNLLAPPTTPPVRTTPVSSSQNSTRNNNAFSPRLARAAPIMGDSFAPSLQFRDELGSGTRELPQGGGATRSKIAENSSSLPMDRLIFNYNHFHNAIDENLVNSTSVDRFTLGFERTFLDQMMSIEVRMPFVADNDFVLPGAFSRNGSEVGNLSVTFKGVLASDDDSLLAAGMTIDTPTGGGSTLVSITDGLTLDASNDAVHLSPFLGFLHTQSGGIAHQAFLQVDVATNANGLTFTDTVGGDTATTELLEQTLLYVDYSFSKEIYNAGRSGRSDLVQRVLGLAELHYTTTLEDSDVVFSGTAMNPLFEVTSTGNRLDVVNLTLGIHTEFSNGTQLRLGTVAPITDGDDRFFDFEFQAQMNILLR